MTGTLPFAGDRVTDLHASMLDGSFKLSGSFSPQLHDLFAQVFQVKPAKVSFSHQQSIEHNDFTFFQRITLEGLKRHAWIVGDDQFVFVAAPPLAPSYEDIQEDIVSHMKMTGFDNDINIVNSIVNNAFVLEASSCNMQFT